MEKLKVFISWSGERSKSVAEAHREWLPTVFQMIEPVFSAADIEKGVKWRQAISGELEKSDFGLICLTPENLTSPWLLFEAGALSKKEEARVCTYLFDVKYEDVKDPLSQFQHTEATEADTWKLIETINRALPSGASLGLEQLKKVFQKWWPDLNDKLTGIAKPSGPAVPERTDSDKISEILTTVRALESVLATREISDVTMTLEAVKELSALQEGLRLSARARLAELSARERELSEAGDRGLEWGNVRAHQKAIRAELQALEAAIDSPGKYNSLLKWLLRRPVG